MQNNGCAINLSIRLMLLKTQNAFWPAILVMKLFKVSSAYDLRRISFIKNNIDRSLFLEGKRAFHKCGADGKWHRPDKVNQKCKMTNRKLLKPKRNVCEIYSFWISKACSWGSYFSSWVSIILIRAYRFWIFLRNQFTSICSRTSILLLIGGEWHWMT